MSSYIHCISTSVPDGFNHQQNIRELMKHYLQGDRKTQAILHRIYTQSGIEKRHSVITDFHKEPNGEALFLNGTTTLAPPSTAIRNDVYKKEASRLFKETGAKLLKESSFAPEDITHVITVSCTGFYAPGPDYELVKALHLKPTTQRFHIGFMGCYAAFPAMKMAQAFCEYDPDAVVMIVATELCSLHFQSSTDVDQLLSGSVFADGSAGLIMSAQKPENHGFQINNFASSLADSGEKDMAWDIGDYGFEMVLSTYVPDIIQANLDDVLQPLFNQFELSHQDIDQWAIHPGGRSIIDKVEEHFQLEAQQIHSSRTVLKEYGNMSSATVLFVLADLLNVDYQSGNKVLPMAFGPGLTIESGLFTMI
ncbi:type III polyketide synthase [Balneola vulgaris]|uniref:type III polyketide synthase n=1 Tax=Balneola vulgaris TaxID=287535 RepID=UPI000362DBBC|nr:3-oxoacyl-[acyl-carrier-protein] synthase III C-terminal domain-containing protein [Balneola vulgaris]